MPRRKAGVQETCPVCFSLFPRGGLHAHQRQRPMCRSPEDSNHDDVESMSDLSSEPPWYWDASDSLLSASSTEMTSDPVSIDSEIEDYPVSANTRSVFARHDVIGGTEVSMDSTRQILTIPFAGAGAFLYPFTRDSCPIVRARRYSPIIG